MKDIHHSIRHLSRSHPENKEGRRARRRKGEEEE